MENFIWFTLKNSIFTLFITEKREKCQIICKTTMFYTRKIPSPNSHPLNELNNFTIFHSCMYCTVYTFINSTQTHLHINGKFISTQYNTMEELDWGRVRLALFVVRAWHVVVYNQWGAFICIWHSIFFVFFKHHHTSLYISSLL